MTEVRPQAVRLRPPTWIEVLVALAIVALVIALLMPAQQAAREVSRRAAREAASRAGAVAAPAAPGEASRQAEAGEPVAPTPRRIIYTAEVELDAVDFDRAAGRLEQLVRSAGGYLAQAEVNGSPGSPRYGTWTARVPVDRFDAFVADVAGLGELRRRQVGAQDVTEEFHDTEARLRTKRVEEARLLKHLEQSTSTLKDTLDVERELSRVREEIERQEGRLKLLQNQTTFTTVTVRLRSIERYAPGSEPGFLTRIGRTFRGSAEALVRFGELILLALAALVPWLPLIVVVLLLLAWAGRQVERRRIRGETGRTADGRTIGDPASLG